MADQPAPPAQPAGKGVKGKGFWTHKLGPFPVWVWALGVGAVGAYYWYTHYGPGASKQQAGQQQPRQRQRRPVTRVTEIFVRRGRGRGGPRPRFAPAAAPSAAAGGPGFGGTMAGVPAPPNPGGPIRPPGQGRNGNGDKDRRRAARGPMEQAVIVHDQPTGQPVDAGTGQPVYWEWTHAHRPPEVSYPVPAPQAAYAPMTSGATYDAASTAGTAVAG